ncbi:MAG: hypothetical protein HYU99_01300 [Deltaproteobacteria bacterium]|nr:hypothetical protein [Deltaproteobacteria bacterium]
MYSIPSILFLFPPLVTLGVGFWIFANAPSLKTSYRKWGQGIGLVIMTGAVFGFVFLASYAIQNGLFGGAKTCPHHHSLQADPGDVNPEDWQKYNVIPPDQPSDANPNP